MTPPWRVRIFEPYHIVVRQDLGWFAGMFILDPSFPRCIPEGVGFRPRGFCGGILGTANRCAPGK